ncbi:hypothetical protein [Grimontia marina]|uniref:Uncharacterized protein n=1 Tax=Grimontia marina TaxID=646534 RepID=A0A128FL03_9GAMM|nr:hypothetical protein [Grimontia marina]CZF86954.1 hypothetical protein GMA8713_04995 [Grimontia marina]
MSELQNAHFWVAKTSLNDISVIFKETYSEDDSPINEFACQQDELFYDHDFFYIEDLSHGIDNFFLSAGIPTENQKPILDALKPHLLNATHIVVGDSSDFKSPRSCVIGSSQFTYVGMFKHW